MADFYFSYSDNELFAETGGLFNVNYISQRKFYEIIRDFMNDSRYNNNSLYQIAPQFIYFYNYFILIENIFNEETRSQ